VRCEDIIYHPCSVPHTFVTKRHLNSFCALTLGGTTRRIEWGQSVYEDWRE